MYRFRYDAFYGDFEALMIETEVLLMNPRGGLRANEFEPNAVWLKDSRADELPEVDWALYNALLEQARHPGPPPPRPG